MRAYHGDYINEKIFKRWYLPETLPDVRPRRASGATADAIGLARWAKKDRVADKEARLREEEDAVRAEIERALEKENLDRERAMAGEAGAADAAAGAGGVKSSAALMGDLEELRQKVERFQTRRALSEFPEVQATTEAVVNCYKCVCGRFHKVQA